MNADALRTETPKKLVPKVTLGPLRAEAMCHHLNDGALAGVFVALGTAQPRGGAPAPGPRLTGHPVFRARVSNRHTVMAKIVGITAHSSNAVRKP